MTMQTLSQDRVVVKRDVRKPQRPRCTKGTAGGGPRPSYVTPVGSSIASRSVEDYGIRYSSLSLSLSHSRCALLCLIVKHTQTQQPLKSSISRCSLHFCSRLAGVGICLFQSSKGAEFTTKGCSGAPRGRSNARASRGKNRAGRAQNTAYFSQHPTHIFFGVK